MLSEVISVSEIVSWKYFKLLDHSDHDIIEFSILREARRGGSRTDILDFQRVDFVLFRQLLDRIPWETVLKGIGVQEGGTLFKKGVLMAEEQAVPRCSKRSW